MLRIETLEHVGHARRTGPLGQAPGVNAASLRAKGFTDAALAKARDLGANVVNGPMPTPIGPMATLSDPQGAMFSLFAPSGQAE